MSSMDCWGAHRVPRGLRLYIKHVSGGFSQGCKLRVIVRQKAWRMRAAFSHSLSRVVAQKASRPYREPLSRLVEEAEEEGILSAHPRTLSRLFLPVDPALLLDDRSQDGSRAETRCIMKESRSWADGDVDKCPTSYAGVATTTLRAVEEAVASKFVRSRGRVFTALVFE